MSIDCTDQRATPCRQRIRCGSVQLVEFLAAKLSRDGEGSWVLFQFWVDIFFDVLAKFLHACLYRRNYSSCVHHILADIGSDPKCVFRDATCGGGHAAAVDGRSEEHTSELQSLMRISYAVFCFNKNK